MEKRPDKEFPNSRKRPSRRTKPGISTWKNSRKTM